MVVQPQGDVLRGEGVFYGADEEVALGALYLCALLCDGGGVILQHPVQTSHGEAVRVVLVRNLGTGDVLALDEEANAQKQQESGK